jgi:hypothetical protein
MGIQYRFNLIGLERNMHLVTQSLERDSVTRFFASGFFHESVSPQPKSILLGPFQIFSKIRGNIRKSRCTTGINETGGKFCHHFR